MSLFGDRTGLGSDAERVDARPFDAAHGIVSRIAAGIVLAIYLPALFAVGVLVARTSHGPALVRKAYRRKKRGGLVYLYEFRTECWRTWTETNVGKLLIIADMHRLPRLVNVLIGDLHMGERIERVGV